MSAPREQRDAAQAMIIALLGAVLAYVTADVVLGAFAEVSGPEAPAQPVGEHPDHACAPENPWGFSLVIKPDGTYSYYVRDTEGELGRALVGDVFQDAAMLLANTTE